MVTVTLKDGTKHTFETCSDMLPLIADYMGEDFAELLEGAIILDGEDFDYWWKAGCP